MAIRDATIALDAVTEAAMIGRALGIAVTPWSLDDWPLDTRLAARALAARWMKRI